MESMNTISRLLRWEELHVEKTVGLSSTGRLFAYGSSNEDVAPENVIEGFRLGARANDQLKVLIPQGGVTSEFIARIVMDGSTSTDGHTVAESSSEKSFNVRRSAAGINSVGTNSDGNTGMQCLCLVAKISAFVLIRPHTRIVFDAR